MPTLLPAESFEALWGLHRPGALKALLDAAEAAGGVLPRAPVVREGAELDEELPEGVALLRIGGVLSKQGNLGVSSVDVREELRRLRSDDAVGGVVLALDSPGGTVAGTRALAEDIRQLAETKPVAVVAEDLCASAAYWAACQVGRIFVEASALVGSIGTYAVLVDSSRAAEREGVRVHVVSTGPHKGAGVPGTVVSEEHIQHLRNLVEAMNGHFLEAVSRGRGLSGTRLKAAASGQVWIGAEAVRMGLADEVGSVRQAGKWVADWIRRRV